MFTPNYLSGCKITEYFVDNGIIGRIKFDISNNANAACLADPPLKKKVYKCTLHLCPSVTYSIKKLFKNDC